MRFTRADHTSWVLSSFWHFEHAHVLLKRWTPLFNPETEQIRVGPIWIRLPGLPLQYWSEDIFRRIGNSLGTFMEYDKSYQTTGMMAYARILVHLDTRGGLQENITIQWRASSCKQLLDYEGTPYHCRRCHQVGHLFRTCPLLRKNKLGTQEMELDPPAEQPPPPATKTHMEEQIKTSNIIEAPAAPVQKKRGKTPIQPPSPPMTRSKAAKGDVFSSGSATQGKNSYQRRQRTGRKRIG